MADPVMGLTIPVPSSTVGPDYATDVSDALQIVANHKHTGVSNLDGYQVPSAGLNIDDDLSIGSNNLTTIRSTRYDDQGAVLAGVGDLNCFYFKGGEAYINDANGTPVQLTAGGSVNAITDNNFTTTTLNSNHTVNSGDAAVVYNYKTWTGNRIFTLPLANSVPAGRFYYIKDQSQSANGSSNTIAVTPSGSDTVENTTSFNIIAAGGAALIMSDGSANWQVYPSNQLSVLYGPSVSITAITTSITATAASTINLNATTTLSLIGDSITSQGKIILPTKAVASSPYTVDTTTKDYIIYVDSTSAAISINLPAASNGRVLHIQDVGGVANTNNITLVRNGSDSIQGLASNYVMDADFQGLTLSGYTGGAWYIIGTS